MKEEVFRVVCISGEFKKGKDFVLEPACPESLNCEWCEDAFYIKKVKVKKKEVGKWKKVMI